MLTRKKKNIIDFWDFYKQCQNFKFKSNQVNIHYYLLNLNIIKDDHNKRVY